MKLASLMTPICIEIIRLQFFLRRLQLLSYPSAVPHLQINVPDVPHPVSAVASQVSQLLLGLYLVTSVTRVLEFPANAPAIAIKNATTGITNLNFFIKMCF